MKGLKLLFAVLACGAVAALVLFLAQDDPAEYGEVVDRAILAAALFAVGWVLCDIALNIRSLKRCTEKTDSSVAED